VVARSRNATQHLPISKKGKVRLLIATDVASRGIHVDDIRARDNYELPEIAEDFVHSRRRHRPRRSKCLAFHFFSRQEMHDLAAMERTLRSRWSA